MEKAAKRRAQALERQKSHHPKSEEVSENSENVNTPKEEDKATTASGSETQGGEEEKPVAQKAKKGYSFSSIYQILLANTLHR